jgi:hypothetical protein
MSPDLELLGLYKRRIKNNENEESMREWYERSI